MATSTAPDPRPTVDDPPILESTPPVSHAPRAGGLRAGVRRTFSAVYEYPAFRRLWFAALAASLGQWMQSTALGWIALQLTDSKSFVGLVAFMAGVPFLIVAIPGGILIDRFDRRRVLMVCQGLAATLAVVVAADVIAGWVRPWHLLLAAFLNGSLQAILNPSQQSLAPQLVARRDLTNAIGLMSASGNMTRVFGPSLAGAIIGFVGSGEAFLVQAAALLLAFGLLATTTFPSLRPMGGTVRAGGVLDGIKLIASRRDLRGLFLLAAIPTFFVFPYISFLSVYARDILKIGPAGLGLLMASSGIGAVIGSLLVAAAANGQGARGHLVTGTILYCGVIAVFSASHHLWLSLPTLVAAGLLGANFMSANNVRLQHRITDDVRGRVMGAYMLTWGLMPLGALPMGLLADHTGIRIATAVGASIGIALTALLAWRTRELFDL